jgi:type II secretory pathway component GspD/PulD (secretin)
MAKSAFRGTVLASGAVLAVLLSGLVPLWGQAPTGRPPSVSSVLQAARESYARGDFEVAADFYKQVQASAAALSPAERADLDRLINQNNIALRQRQEGRDQLRQADEALRRGQLQRAGSLLKIVTTNPYLAPQDRQAANQMNDQLRALANGTRTAPTPAGKAQMPPPGALALPPNADAKTVLAAARTALQHGDLDRAEGLALYAKQMNSGGLPPWLHPWSDTPAKVLRDVEAARARQAAARQKAAEAKKNESSSSPLQSMKNLFGWKSSPAKGAEQAANGDSAQGAAGSSYNTTHGMGPAGPDTRDPATRARDTAQAKQMMVDCYQALTKNDLEKARQLALRAQALRPDLRAGEQTPERLLAEVQARANRLRPASFAEGPKAPQPPAGVPQAALSQEQATQKARLLVREGYKALEKNELEKARRYAEQAQALKPNLQYFEENPDKLLHDIQNRSPARPGPAVAGMPARPAQKTEDAHALLKSARDLLKQGKLEEADKACARAAIAPGARWGLFEDNPDKVRADIQQARSRHDREEAARLLVEARKLFEQGKLKEAKELAARARQKHGPYTILDLGDRPDHLLAEIELAEMKLRTVQVPAIPSTGVMPPPPNAGPTAPVIQQTQAKGPAVPTPVLAQGPVIPQGGVVVPPPPNAGFTPPAVQQTQANGPAVPTPGLAQGPAIPQGGVVVPPPPNAGPTPPDIQQTQANGPAVPTPGLTQGPAIPRGSVVVPPPPQPAADTADTRQQLARQRILMLMGEARELHKGDRLVEARLKLVEAREAAGQAALLGFRFSAQDETPDGALGILSASCGKRIHALLVHADELAAQGPANPRHFEEANKELAQARLLASSFGLDLRSIEEKTSRVEQLQVALAQGVAPVVPSPPGAEEGTMPTGPAAEGKPDGRRLLDDARQELRRGQTGPARRMAEMAMEDPAPGVRKEAEELIRSIDAEEVQQKLLAMERNADALRDAYNHGDYRQAATIARTLDWRQLSDKNRARLKEIMSMPAMQAALEGRDAPALVEPRGAGKASATDLAQAPPAPAAPGTPKGPDDFEEYKLRDQVLFDKLRKEGLEIQIKARDTFNAGNRAGALEMLGEYVERLKESGLEPEKTALLSAQVEKRRQQMQVLNAQMSLDQAVLDSKFAMTKEAARAKQILRKQEEVADLMKRYQTLFEEHKYNECLVLLAQAKEIDPENAAVTVAIKMTKYKARVEKIEQMKDEKSQTFLEVLDDPPGPYVGDMKNPIKFDKDRTEQIMRRKALSKEGFPIARSDEKERQIEEKLLQPIPPISFTNTPLQRVIDDLNAMTGINIIPDTMALEENGISLDQRLSLSVSNISLKSALNILLRKVHLTYVIKDQVLQVTTENYASGKMKQVIYPVADLVIPVDDHAPPMVSDLTNTLQRFNESQMMGPRGITPYVPLGGITGGAPVSMQDAMNNPGSFASSTPAATPMQSGVSKQWTKNTIHENLIKLITTTIAPESWSEMGGKGQIQYYPLGLGLVVNQVQDIQEQVAALLAALRRLQDLEVAIEIRLVAVAESFYERMGLDFDINIVTPTSNSEPLLTSGNFQPVPFVNRFTPSKFGPVGLTPAGTFTPDLNIPIKQSSFDFATPPFGNYPGTLGADGGFTLGLAFLSDIQVFMLLEAAQGDQRTNTMQAPRVTVFNGQSAFISVNTFQFFLIGVNINTAADQIFFTPQNQAVPLGVNLFVTPVVTADRRFVRLSLAPNMTNLASATVPLVPVQIPVPQLLQDNFTNPQPVIFQMFFQQPTFETINVNTTVLVPDGGTVLLGGLKTMSEGRNEFGPPILSKIPYISRLFKNIAYGRDAHSLMIMVTPRIIINEEEEQIFLGNVPPLPRP